MIANVQTSMFSDDAWTPPMICQVLAEQLVNCFRRSARWRQSSTGLLSSEPLESSWIQRLRHVHLEKWPLKQRESFITILVSLYNAMICLYCLLQLRQCSDDINGRLQMRKILTSKMPWPWKPG